MKQVWTPDELGDHWTLTFEDLALLKRKPASGRLGFCAQLKYYQLYACFPQNHREFAVDVNEYLAQQIEVSSDELNSYDWNGRTGRRHRQEVLEYLEVKPFEEHAEATFRQWLSDTVFPREPDKNHLNELVVDWFLSSKVNPPGPVRLERTIRSVQQEYEQFILTSIYDKLKEPVRARLDDLVVEKDGVVAYTRLRSDAGRIGLQSVFKEIDKLKQLRALGLSKDILAGLSSKLIERFRQRAATESPWELRRHSDWIRYPLLVFFCVPRESEIIDSLIELLIQIIHRITVRAERRVVKELVDSIQKVQGKTNILFRIAKAALENPDGTIRDVIFPVAGEQVIKKLVKEFHSGGLAYQKRIYTVIRASYSSHYRRMLPKILDALEFCSNNSAHRPILDAIEAINQHQDSRLQHYTLDEVIIDGVVRNKWREIVIESAPDGSERISRINYEICVLQALRDRLRCKEIWVVGADRYRNPDEDLPTDFDERRDEYYANLSQPTDVYEFILFLKDKMFTALDCLNHRLPKNPKLRINQRGKYPITVSRLDAQPEPANLEKLKYELSCRWPMISLLEVIKETDLRVGFTNAFSSAASREVTDRLEVQRRLLLCLYGLGTNAGLKRVSAGRHGITYKELLHVRRRYIHKAALRNAIRKVVNAIFEVRAPDIWGEGTTACASDSKKFGAWDQNLMTEWHIRYGGRGVMIYWHVEKKSTCIYSQLKRCSSSEVAAMIEGVLRHCTDMQIERQYVDSHGQSEVAFAFCHLLGFALLPRLKAIGAQKLYLPESNTKARFANLEPILTRPINWDLIGNQYNEMIKYATALKEGTAEPESILRRFTRSNVRHPTYRALSELGKVVKTNFLCDYLDSEQLRREIHEGLNIVENWNSTNSFIFFGKGGEVATNRLEDQEISVLALHLLQICLVYINTLMFQEILREQSWRSQMTEYDFRALTPLVYSHVNPYGIFELNMEQRLPIETRAVA